MAETDFKHPAYGSILGFNREQNARWQTVRYGAERARARTDHEFLLSAAEEFE
jgi:hypothetical protein